LRRRAIAVPVVLSADFEARYQAARERNPDLAQRLLDLEVRRTLVCGAPARPRLHRRIGHNSRRAL
jgi:hypothetical protein